MKINFLLPALLILALSQQLNARLVFSVASSSLTEGTNSFEAEIRVTGALGDSLQYFAIQAVGTTLTGGKTLTITPVGSPGDSLATNSLYGLNANTRSSTDYLFYDRGQAVTGAGSAVYISSASSATAQFRDGVAIPQLVDSGGSNIPNDPVAPNNPPGSTSRLIARIKFTASGNFLAGDSFEISLAGLPGNVNNFRSLPPGPPPPGFDFTGAAIWNGTSGQSLDPQFNSGVFSITAVPEPSSLMLIALAGCGLAAKRLRRRRAVI